MIGQGRPVMALIFILTICFSMLSLWAAHGEQRFSPMRSPSPISAGVQRTASGQKSSEQKLRQQKTVLPHFDDAHLHDVQFVGKKIGWAVGDHGVIWKTVDGGQRWTLLDSPVTCSLRSICFLTDRIGWIAGGGTVPFSRASYGLLLATKDGGLHWDLVAANRHGLRNPQRVQREIQQQKIQQQQKNQQRKNQRSVAVPWAELPSLHYVKFFGLKQGVAVGDASRQFPSGVLLTADGGKTWKPAVEAKADKEKINGEKVNGENRNGWRAADFVGPQTGTVAGLYGAMSLVGRGRMIKPGVDHSGLRTVHELTIQQDGSGWMVGDGGLLQQTSNGGALWKSPRGALPRLFRDFSDFHTVAQRGANVWVAGSPGSSIFHSNNGGRTWQRQLTGQTVPIHSLTFSSDSHGWAVGALGLILRTTNGGKTWVAVRGGRRRVAFMGVHGHVGQVSFPLIAKQSAELGYRSVMLLPARWDVGPNGREFVGIDRRFSEAVQVAGGSGGVIGWQFPLAVPGLAQNKKLLLKDWKNRAEGRLQTVFLGRLVAQLRMWRPTVIVLDQPVAGDALTKLLNDAVLQAIRFASDSTAFAQQLTLMNLRPWSVQKVYQRVSPGAVGHDQILPHDYLPRLGKTVGFVSSLATRQLGLSQTKKGALKKWFAKSEQPQIYRLIFERKDQQKKRVGNEQKNGRFFSGVDLPTGSAARRKLMPWNKTDIELKMKLAQRQRNFRSIIQRTIHDSRLSTTLISQLKSVTAKMEPEQAASQIFELANRYLERGNWELAEAAMIELVSQYPTTSVASEGMEWLFHLWSGAEPIWQRVRATRVTRKSTGGDSSKTVSREGNQQWRAKKIRHWNEQALRISSTLKKVDAERHRSPAVQFSLAALLRSRGTGTGAERMVKRIYQQHQFSGPKDFWQKTASSEMWMQAPKGLPPKPISICRSCAKRPRLDGVLSDDCWKNAKAISLTTPKKLGPLRAESARVLISYDAKFFYLAGEVPRVAGLPTDGPLRKGRRHDADLSAYDRISISLDLDRDYATYYRLEIDQRGCTTDSCFGVRAWNPKWYVATKSDAKSWRFEVAIPWEELAPRAAVRDNVWAVGLVRTMPAIGWQSWTHPAGSEPRPESFGLLQFK